MLLYPHQQKILDLNPARHLLAFGTGTGKTITALALSERNCRTCLVVVPKMLKPMWLRETATHGKNCTYTVITKEEFRRDALILPPYDGVIVDEAHAFAGEKSKLSKMMKHYLNKHDIKYRWFCTATPYLSTPMNIYVLAILLGHKMNWMSFRKEYFYDVRMGHMIIPKVKPGIEAKLAALVAMIGSTVDLDSAVEQAQANPVADLPALRDVPDQTFKTEYFDLTPPQKEAIKALDEVEFITRWTKTHQIEQGFLYSDGYMDTQAFDCDKTARIIELCKENPKVAIFCRYNYQINHIENQIREAGITTKVYTLNGDTRNRDALVTEADAQASAIIIIQAQCSAGYELPSFPLIIFASMSFSFVDYTQAIGRFLRINKLKKNTYLHLVSNGVDRDVYDCIMKKQDFSIEIYRS